MTATARSLAAFWDESAFAVDDAQFQWLDVALGAMVRSEWGAFERRLSEGLACVARAAAEGATADDDVEEALTAFRYDHDLISGSEVNAWLEASGFGVVEWTAYFSRQVFRDRYAHDLDRTLDRYVPSTRLLHEAALAEGVCSGQFATFERALANRVALAVEADPRVLDTGGRAPDDLISEAARLTHRHGHWLSGGTAGDVEGRCVRLLCVERAFGDAAAALTVPELLQHQVDSRHIEWTRVAFEGLSFTTEHAAREALLCVRVDGVSLDEVGRLARQPLQRSSRFVEDLPPELRTTLLSAAVGDVLGPMACDGRFEMGKVVDRRLPSLDDDHVAERARHAVIEEASARAARERVQRRPRG